MTGAQDRLTGFAAGLRAAGLAGLVEHGDYTESSGFRAARALLAAEPRLDGLFAASDQMALGALRALRQAGREVPGDVAVVGYDDLAGAAADPPLTSVRQPVDLVAQELVRLLAARIDGRPAEPVVLPTTLVRRASA
jgi:DNA-binding LacI/PurR family transcriptional regulator